jgi:hypothetical protein
MAYIRTDWEVRIVVYMDDVLSLHQDRSYLELATFQIAIHLRSLGWTPLMEKCEFTPAQDITLLGW